MSQQDYTVLVIEDDYGLNTLLQLKISQKGMNVIGVLSGEEAIQALRKDEQFIVVSDYQLPDMQCAELILKLKEEGIVFPFIVMTGYGDQKIAVEMMKMGALDYVVKEIGFADHIPSIVKRNISLHKTNLELKESNDKIFRSEEKIRSIFENIQDVYFVLNKNGIIQDISPGCLAVFGENREEMAGRDLSSYFRDKKSINRIKNAISAGSCVIDSEIHIQSRKNDEIRMCLITCNRTHFSYSKEEQIVGIIRDITEKRQLERELQRRILEAEENEKKKLAEDLHDGLGPLLSAVKIYLNMLDNTKRPEAEQLKLIHEARDIIDEAVKATRDLSHLLMPNILRDYGLIRATDSFLNRINPENKLKVSLNSNISDKRLGISLETILYRTITELVNNTVKHSDAQSISLSILEAEGVIELVYVDDGKGFESEMITEKGQGLSTIRSRIHAVGGEIMFSSSPGKGIRVVITLHSAYLNIAND